MKYTAYFTISGFFTFNATDEKDAEITAKKLADRIYNEPEELYNYTSGAIVDNITEGE